MSVCVCFSSLIHPHQNSHSFACTSWNVCCLYVAMCANLWWAHCCSFFLYDFSFLRRIIMSVSLLLRKINLDDDALIFHNSKFMIFSFWFYILFDIINVTFYQYSISPLRRVGSNQYTIITATSNQPRKAIPNRTKLRPSHTNKPFIPFSNRLVPAILYCWLKSSPLQSVQQSASASSGNATSSPTAHPFHVGFRNWCFHPVAKSDARSISVQRIRSSNVAGSHRLILI